MGAAAMHGLRHPWILASLSLSCLGQGSAFNLQVGGFPGSLKWHTRNACISSRTRFSSGAGALSLSSSALKIDPANAWTKHATGDSGDIATILKNVEVLRPAPDGSRVRVGDVVKGKKALVCFMRHTG